MEIKIKKPKDIRIIPKCLAKEDNPPVIIFKEPTASDIVHFLTFGDYDAVLDRCFVGFENKPVLKFENGGEFEFITYRQFINSGFAPMLNSIHHEVLDNFTKAVKKLAEDGKSTEKKSQ